MYHAFRVRAFFLYLDLEELPGALDRTWLGSTRRAAPLRFRREDYLGAPELPLAEAVRREVAKQTGTRPEGPIGLLTQVRTFGYVFNPVSLFYCHDRTGALQFLAADVTNTPWRERHCYVAPYRPGTMHVPKAFHVSPFLPMDLEYDWRFSTPGERLRLAMICRRAGERVFDAGVSLARRSLSDASLARALVRFPFQTARVTGGIYWQALRLRAKGVPFYPHPDTTAGTTVHADAAPGR